MRVIIVVLLLLAAPVAAQGSDPDPEIDDAQGDTEVPWLDIVRVWFERGDDQIPHLRMALAGPVPSADLGTGGVAGAISEYSVGFELHDGNGDRVGARTAQYASLFIEEANVLAYVCIYDAGQGGCPPTQNAELDGATITWLFDVPPFTDASAAGPYSFESLTASTAGSLFGNDLPGDRARDEDPHTEPEAPIPTADSPGPSKPLATPRVDEGAVAAVVASVGACLVLWHVLRQMSRHRLPRSLLALGLFTRIQRAEALRHDRRAALFETIQAEPGITFSELRRRFDLGSGSLAYHLKVLEQQDLVAHEHDRARRRFYARGARVRLDDYVGPLQRAVWDAVKEHPGATPAALAGTVGLPRHSVQYHLGRLVSAGHLRRRRDGRHSRYYA